VPANHERSHSVPPQGELLTVHEAALLLRCSDSLVYKLMKIGEIAYERRGRRKLPLARSVTDYRQRSRIEATPPAMPGSTPRPGRYLHLFSKTAK
jgi:excisionase family DNA binding protein